MMMMYTQTWFTFALLPLATTAQGFISPRTTTSSRQTADESTTDSTTTTALFVSTTALPFFVDQENEVVGPPPTRLLYKPRPPQTAPPLELVMRQQSRRTSLWASWQSAMANADVHIGTRILQAVFDEASNGNGQMTADGLQTALSSGAFAMLDADHIQGIYDRAAASDGKKHKGYVTLDEWLAESTQTLRG